jgi:deoxyribonuclease-4
MPIFQCFFLHQDTMRFIRPTREEIAEFVRMQDNFKQLFVHSSYWTNLASIEQISFRMLENELNLAKRLGFAKLIIHPGCTKGAVDRMEGIDALVRRLNDILKHEHDVQLVLENTAHGKHSVGSDLNDFKIILEKMDQPEKIAFCIDTAHAHAYGYALHSPEDRALFFETVDRTIGFDRIALLHLNNTVGQVGSLLDRHVLLEEGSISLDALQACILHPKFERIPVIMELPAASHEVELAHMQLVRSWHA